MRNNKITQIINDGLYKDKPKWKVTFDDNSQWTFFQKEKTKHDDYNVKNVGDWLNWEIGNEEYNTARSKDFAVPKFMSKPKGDWNKGKHKADQRQIAKSVSFKGCIELVAAGKVSIDEIPSKTNEWAELILN